MSEAYSPSPSETGASHVQPGPTRSPVLKIILFGILVVALGALGYDYMGRIKRDSALNKVAALMPSDESPPTQEAVLDGTPTPDEVLKVIGREPDAPPVRDGNDMTATYSWPGVFYTHKLVILYSGTLDPRAIRAEKHSTSNF